MSTTADTTGSNEDPQETPEITVEFDIRQIEPGRTVGKVQVRGLRHISQIEPVALLNALMASRDGATALAKQEPVRLQDIAEGPAARAARVENRRIGRLAYARVRRLEAAGMDRREALEALSREFGRRPSELALLLKLHTKSCLPRARRVRNARVLRLRAEGRTQREIAEHLKVSQQHIGRLLREIDQEKSQ